MIKRVVVLILMAGVYFFVAPHVFAATFIVDSVSDTGDSNTGDNLCDIGDGSCTLRAALEQAQATAGTDVITIDASLTGQTTSPTTAYANQSGQTISIIGPGMDDFTIDAAAADVSTLFSLSNVDNGTFSGFSVINVFEVGFLAMSDSNTNTFTDIGIHGEGTDMGSALIQLTGSSSNTISECELSEGGLGVRIQENSNSNIVENCTSTSQQHSGLTMYDSSNNTFRGNTIADSEESGMYIIFGANDNTIEDNILTGGIVGIQMGNLGADSGATNNNIFQGNEVTGFILGIGIAGSGNLIGGANPGDGNSIHDNAVGLFVGQDVANQNNSVLRNSIINNQMGFDLLEVDDNDNELYRETPNDYLDSDDGPNGYLNHPILLSATQTGGDIILNYMLDVPVGTYRLEFFTNPSQARDNGFGEGEVYEDVENITVSAAGPQIMSLVTVNNATLTNGLTATITECSGGCATFGGTSEFSNNITATSGGIDRGTASGEETELIENGAYHIITDAFLGLCVNADTDTQDDSEGSGGCTDDRDGVTGLDTAFTVGDTITTTVTASEPGFLSVWMDLDRDGSFDGVDEQLFTNDAITGTQDFVLPVTAPSAGTYNIRFRYTTYDHDGLLATGEALDGEVEDYVITTVAAASENPIVASRPVVVSGGCPKDWLLVNGTCQYQKTQLLEVSQILGSGVCPANLIIHDFMKDGDRNGKYSNYNKKVITEVNILQAHINRILAVQYKQAAGPVDGIFKSKTKLGVMRLQTALNSILKPVPVLKLDGIVGPYTREAINRSCGGM
jgi:parallel beta-helix repeat protein